MLLNRKLKPIITSFIIFLKLLFSTSDSDVRPWLRTSALVKVLRNAHGLHIANYTKKINRARR